MISLTQGVSAPQLPKFSYSNLPPAHAANWQEAERVLRSQQKTIELLIAAIVELQNQ